MTTTPPGPQKGPVTRERAFEIGREAIAGAGPFVVERADGGLQFLSTSVPPFRAIAEYERRRAEAPQKA